MRLEQAAGPDAREVGEQHVFFGLVLDAAKQAVVEGLSSMMTGAPFRPSLSTTRLTR